VSYSVTPDRTVALERMTQALEAAKKARDSGVDVHQGREFLKRSRAAFEAGNYPLAKQLADQVLEIYGKTAAVVPAGAGRSEVLARMAEALDAVKRTKRLGVDVRRAREVLKQARSAYKAGNYGTALELANETLTLCGLPRT